MRSLLRVLGGTVSRVECISKEVGDFSYMYDDDDEAQHLNLPHLQFVRMNDAYFEDVLRIVQSLPALRLLEVDCLHESQKQTGFGLTGNKCCWCHLGHWSLEELQSILERLTDHISAADGLEVRVHEFCLLNPCCSDCCAALQDALEPLGTRLLGCVQKLQTGPGTMDHHVMASFAQLMPFVRHLQVSYYPVPGPHLILSSVFP